MTGILGKFQVEHDVRGVRLVTKSSQLTGYCTDDGQIENAVEMLKADLDACAREMKRLLALDQRGSMFEGWPSARDGMLSS